MPALSLYRPTKSNDYKFFDRMVAGQLRIGGTDMLIHKYLGIDNTGPSIDPTQPQYLEPNPTQIQDLLFLENRDRKYEASVYRLRGHYNVANLDFDLSQFGLFLNNDVIFIVTHLNEMLSIVGRKLMVGDVLELPHLIDYSPLDETIPVALKRFYQVTDANFASEGFSATWYPHLWRIKCEPLVNSEEFSDILDQPIDQDNYLGDFDPTKVYPPGYTITYGGKIYESTTTVPAGTTPPNEDYWQVVDNGSLSDILSTYNKNIAINDAALQEAHRQVQLSGYDVNNLYVVPTYGEGSSKLDQPAPPININTSPLGATASGSVVMMRHPNYKNAAPGLKIPRSLLKNIQELTTSGMAEQIDLFVQATLEYMEEAPVLTDSGSGSVEPIKVLSVQSMGAITGPYGTADNTYATSDQNPALSSFTGEVTINMDYRADCIPGYQYIARSSPRTFGYTTGYLTGDGRAPNGFPTGAGIAFPANPRIGDYYLRIDYAPQLLYRWDGSRWVRISEKVRTETGFTPDNTSLLSGFINNLDEIRMNSTGELEPSAQPLYTILRATPDALPPEG